MSERTLTTDRLLKAGFERIGSWEVNDVGELSHRLALPARPGVYAFAIDGSVRYVGLASTSLKQRLGFYRKPGASQTTNVRLNAEIRREIAGEACVEVLLAEPPDGEWNGLVIRGAQGLEAGLIGSFDLPWNVKGSRVGESSAGVTNLTSRGVKERILEYVGKHPHKTEADIARALYGPKATQQRVNGHCRELVAADLLVRQGSGGSGDAFTYRLKKKRDPGSSPA